MKIEDMNPTFMLRIEDKRYLHLGLLPHDKVMCDYNYNYTQPARLVVAAWDDYAHICSLAGDTFLFDEEAHAPAPDNAVICGRVLYLSRALCPETAEEALA